MALITAAGKGHEEVVRALLSRGADARLRREDGARALDTAARRGHLAIVEQLVMHDPALLALPGCKERTALMAAVLGGHAVLVAWLLARGADPRARAEDGSRALDLAAAAGHTGVLEVLLAHDPGLLDLPGDADRTALNMTAGGGHEDGVALLLARGADPRLRGDKGSLPLDDAAQEGHEAIVGRLLAHDPGLLELPGYRDRTALMAAAGNGQAALVASLLKRGADPHARLDDGARALDWAAAAGHTGVPEVLLAHDPGLLDLPGDADRTALNMAAGGGHEDGVALLLARGADPAAGRRRRAAAGRCGPGGA